MKKFEYHLISRNSLVDAKNEFNQLGQDGWELASCFQGGMVFWITFKREITEPVEPKVKRVTKRATKKTQLNG